MSTPIKTISYTASNARKNFYGLVREAAVGAQAYEIHLQGCEPVIMMSKEEFEGWLETMDILSNPEEAQSLREAIADTDEKTIPFDEVLKQLGIEDEVRTEKKSD